MVRLFHKNITFLSSAQLLLSLSLLYGTWVIYIPKIVEKLKMTESQLGITLLFAAIGAIIGTFAGKPMIAKIGEGKMSLYSILFMSFVMIAVFIAPSYIILTAIFMAWGFGSGVFQIAVNSMINAIERQQQISIMSSCHGFFSLGALISSGLGTLLLIALDNPLIHVLIAAGLVIMLQITFGKHFFSIRSKIEVEKAHTGVSVKRLGILVILALISLVAMVSEGGIADWSGLFLNDVVKINSNLVGLGYAGFSLAMTLGRFLGDSFSKKFGPTKIILVGFLISLAGFLLVLTAVHYVSLTGFFIVGIGFSIIVPEVYRLSANIHGIESSVGIAFVSGSAFVGFLAGPPILGFVAEHSGLTNSFICLLGLVVLGILMTFVINLKANALSVKVTSQS